MSDPAFESIGLPERAIPIEDVPQNPNAVFLFDFDGVIASGIEDAIYKLPTSDSELEKLHDLAQKFCMQIAEMEPRYQRHLLFQEAAKRIDLPIEPGPGMALAKWACGEARTFILTARSGWSATTRVREFIETHLKPPIELYQLGRTSKKLQVSLLCEEFPSSPVYYIEDSFAHLADASGLDFPNLGLAYCSQEISSDRAAGLYKRVLFGELIDVRS